MNINKILVPIDFSECSINALRYALELKKVTNSTIKIIHGYRVPIPRGGPGIELEIPSPETYKRQADSKMDVLRMEMPELQGVNYEYQLVMAFAQDAILEIEKEADLIVLGTKGISNKVDEYFGSNAYGVITHAKSPVITVPLTFKFETVKNIIFASDYKSMEHVERLELLKSLSKLFNANIHILHVGDLVTEGDNIDKHTAINFNRYLHDVHHTFAFSGEEEVEEGINRYIKEHNAELLVMYPRKHPFFERLFHHSVTKNMAHHTALPLLTIHE